MRSRFLVQIMQTVWNGGTCQKLHIPTPLNSKKVLMMPEESGVLTVPIR